MSPLSSERLLAIWEHGVIRHPLDRALLMYAQVRPDLAPDQLADRPLGDRNAALMRLRWRNFGPRLALWLDCPSCGERMEFELTAEQLPMMLAPPESVEVDGQLYRCPTSRDLAQLVGFTDMDTATRQLAQACGASPERCAQIESAIEAADPWADLALEFCCPACAHVGEASLDIAAYLWEEIDCKARGLLDEIHLLAQAYGWNESEILALSDNRRSAYLARVMA